MSTSLYDRTYLINFSAVDDIIVSLKRNENILNIDHAIQLNSIFENLRRGSSLSEIIQEFTKQIEKYIIIRILEYANGNKSMAARILKINYKTIYYKIKMYSI
jgi:transcriptional regulator with PAS, ATPase and Fis domain